MHLYVSLKQKVHAYKIGQKQIFIFKRTLEFDIKIIAFTLINGKVEKCLKRYHSIKIITDK